MNRIIIFLLLIFCISTAQAKDVLIDGIYYALYPDELKATVVNDGNKSDDNGSGYEISELLIPETIVYEGITYTVKSIGDYAFCNTKSLKSITLSDSITKIGMRAFAQCDSLQSIYIPKNVVMVGSYAFEASHALQTIDVAAENMTYSSISDCLCNKEGTMLILAPGGRDSIVVAEGITAIDHYAFAYCNLQYVELPLSLQTIDHYAFSYCNALQSVAIPDGVTELGANIFRESLNLRSVVFGRNIKKMGNYSFIGCASIDTITILAPEPPIAKDLSLNADSCLLRVFQKSYFAYAKHEYWLKFANISTLNTIELDVNNDECGTVKGAGYYDTNTDVVIEAQAFEGYEFVDWSDGATDNPRTMNLVSDIELIANFRVKESSVDVNHTISDAVIYLHENVLHVENISTDYQLYDIFSRKIYVGSARELNLTSGVYLIVIENKTIKIVV